MKIDKDETRAGKSLYVPLRLVKEPSVEEAPHSATLVRINYEAGLTPDYRYWEHNILIYSDLIRDAVAEAVGEPDIDDRGLVVKVRLDLTKFHAPDEGEENDRWISLTRVLTDEGLWCGGPAGPLLKALADDRTRKRYRDKYPRLLSIRWVGIWKGSKPQSWSKDRYYSILVDEQYEAEFLSSLLPIEDFEDRSFRWKLAGPARHFDFLGRSVEIGPGIARHHLPLEARRATKGPVILTLSPSQRDGAASPHQFDIHLSFKPGYKFSALLFSAGIVLFLAVGVVLAAGIVNQRLVERIGVDEGWADRIGDGSPAVGVFLLIVGAIMAQTWQTARRTE